MASFDDLNKNNVFLYASREYDRPHMIQAEFKDDLRRLQYIKRLITKYKSGKKLRVDLIINHLIVFYNVFGIVAGSRILFCCIPEEDWQVIKPFLVYLSHLQECIKGVNGTDIHTDVIPMDEVVVHNIRRFNTDG